MVRQVTAKRRYARALAAVSDWCRKNRHRPILDQHRRLSSMMRGHFAYYGVGGNMYDCSGSHTKLCGSGRSGCLGEIVRAWSDGHA